MKISVIIPTLNATGTLKQVLDALEHQIVEPEEIVIVDSESDDSTIAIAKAMSKVRILTIQRKEFDHGRTRDFALRTCDSDYVLFLTQDAIPANEHYIENIIKPFDDKKVIGVSGRQLPKPNARDYEALIRKYNYPATSNVRTAEDIEKMGIKAFFFSDSCSAIRKDKYLEIGGFDYPIKTDEDLFFAAKALKAGYKIAYAADATVYHSHNFTLKEQYRRNYIQGVEFKSHKEILNGVSLESEGMKMVSTITKELLRKGKVLSTVEFYLDCAARYLGSRAGRK